MQVTECLGYTCLHYARMVIGASNMTILVIISQGGNDRCFVDPDADNEASALASAVERCNIPADSTTLKEDGTVSHPTASIDIIYIDKFTEIYV